MLCNFFFSVRYVFTCRIHILLIVLPAVLVIRWVNFQLVPFARTRQRDATGHRPIRLSLNKQYIKIPLPLPLFSIHHSIPSIHVYKPTHRGAANVYSVYDLLTRLPYTRSNITNLHSYTSDKWSLPHTFTTLQLQKLLLLSQKFTLMKAKWICEFAWMDDTRGKCGLKNPLLLKKAVD